jgi:hypothetical protein
MSVNLWEAPTVNAFPARLDGTLDGSSTSITLDSTTGLVAPGVLCIDRQDGSGNNTPTKREYVSFTAIVGNSVTGVTRGVASSQAQQHSSGALVESLPNVTMWGDLVDFIQVEHSSAGGHVISTATVSYIEDIQMAVTSLASIAQANITNLISNKIIISSATITGLINASGASIVGWGGVGGLAPFAIVGVVAAGTNVTPYLTVEDAMTLKSVSMVLKSPVSGASLVIDVNKNGTTIFTDQNTRASILAGGTYVSTSSLAVTALVPGNLLSLDIDNGAGGGSDLTVLLET